MQAHIPLPGGLSLMFADAASGDGRYATSRLQRGLLRAGAAVIMVFFLTRAWLSEPNIILALPFVLILATLGDLPRGWLHAVWILPLIFGIANVSITQLFFPSTPHLADWLYMQMERIHIANTLKMTGGNREKTAKILNIGARTLYRKLREYQLQ